MSSEISADSDSDPKRGRSDGEEEEEEEIPEYEKQRLSRIRENKARLQSLGLPALASSLLKSIENKKKPNTKNKVPNKQTRKRPDQNDDEDDDEYKPSDSDGEDSENSLYTNDDDDDDDDDDDNEETNASSTSKRSFKSKGKGKSHLTGAKLHRTSPVQKHVNELNLVDDDVSLQQAIALSLGGRPAGFPSLLGGSSQSPSTSKKDVDHNGRQEGLGTTEATQKRKRKRSYNNRVQLTEDEMLAYFLSFDEAGKGIISVLDLLRVAEAHDFNWTDKEIADMIYCFDSDRDGKLNLSDFRKIVGRCNMMQSSEGC